MRTSTFYRNDAEEDSIRHGCCTWSRSGPRWRRSCHHNCTRYRTTCCAHRIHQDDHTMHEGTRKRAYNVVLELLTVDRDRGSGEDVEETELIITLLDALGITVSFNRVDHNADVSGINVLVVDLGAVELSRWQWSCPDHRSRWCCGRSREQWGRRRRAWSWECD